MVESQNEEKRIGEKHINVSLSPKIHTNLIQAGKLQRGNAMAWIRPTMRLKHRLLLVPVAIAAVVFLHTGYDINVM